MQQQMRRTAADSLASHHILANNDDGAAGEFIVTILRDVFALDENQTIAALLRVHLRGRCPVARLPKEVARRQVELMYQQARAAGYPLALTLEAAASW